MDKEIVQFQIDRMDLLINGLDHAISYHFKDVKNAESDPYFITLSDDKRIYKLIKENLIAIRNLGEAYTREQKNGHAILNEDSTWTDRINRQVAFLTRLGKDSTTNRNGGTIVYAADAPMLAGIINNLEELSKRIPKMKADYDS